MEYWQGKKSKWLNNVDVLFLALGKPPYLKNCMSNRQWQLKAKIFQAPCMTSNMKGQRQYGIQMKMPNKSQQKLKEKFYHITKAQALWMTSNMKGQRQYGIQMKRPNKGQQKLKEKFYHITKTQGNNTLVKKFNNKTLISANKVNMYSVKNELILTK